jgi:hypothetical protein
MTSGPDLGERWPAWLVATAEEGGLSIRRNPHAPFAAVIVIVGTIGVVPRGLTIKTTKRRAAIAWRLEVFWEVSKSKDGWMTPH